MAPRGAKRRGTTGDGKVALPQIRPSAIKAWAGVASSELDMRVLCKGDQDCLSLCCKCTARW